MHAGILSLQKNEPTLEDVFIKLVGRSLTATTTERIGVGAGMRGNVLTYSLSARSRSTNPQET